MKHLRVLALVMTFALIAAGCGDSGSSEFDDAVEAAVTSDDGGDSDDDSPFGTGDTLPSTIGDLPGVSGECEAIVNVFLAFGSAFTGGGFAAPDLSAFSDLPGDLQDDAALMVQTLADYSQGLEDLGIDLTDPAAMSNLTEAQQQALAGLGSGLDSEAFNEAADNLGNYAEAECDDFAGFGN